MAYPTDNPLDGRGRPAASPFAQGADILDDLAAIFTARKDDGGVISASQAANVEQTLVRVAELIRLGERQRVALVQLLARPVAADGVTLVLVPGDRA